MSETATAAGQAAAVNAILQPGQSASIFFGEEPETFRVSLTGTIQRQGELDVDVDGVKAATLDFTVRNTTVNGRRITVTNVGRESQGFIARQV
ncbi:MAG: hypothetical protein AAGF23_23980 [Acidobacteriota bacterium]